MGRSCDELAMSDSRSECRSCLRSGSRAGSQRGRRRESWDSAGPVRRQRTETVSAKRAAPFHQKRGFVALVPPTDVRASVRRKAPSAPGILPSGRGKSVAAPRRWRRSRPVDVPGRGAVRVSRGAVLGSWSGREGCDLSAPSQLHPYSRQEISRRVHSAYAAAPWPGRFA
jgi:hypothetical protein